MTQSDPPPDNGRTLSGIRRRFGRKPAVAALAGAILVVGAAAGAGGTQLAQRWQPQSVMLLQPAPITALREGIPVAVKGAVAEIFGNKFIIQDDGGRALADLGPRGENRNVVSQGETVTVQGRFDRGMIHAIILSHADGRTEAFGPPNPPPRPKRDHGPKGKRSERGDAGPPLPPDRTPPPRPDRAPPPAPAAPAQ
jgi:hypothetical protein